MSIELATKYSPKVDEVFKAESKLSLLTNLDYDWLNANVVQVYKISTVPMNDYTRNVFADEEEDNPVNISRYGALHDLDAGTEKLLLSKDRSFIFNIDKLDYDETARALEQSSALARQIREVVIPEVDTYTYNKMVTGAGTKATATALTSENIYENITAGNEAMDDAEVPDTERAIVVTPTTYKLIKHAKLFDNTDIGEEMRIKGVVGMIDGNLVIKVPASRLPEDFGFMIVHPSATVAPTKLQDYGFHEDTVISSGVVVTGRVAYDAFVLDNKKKGIYYQPITAA